MDIRTCETCGTTLRARHSHRARFCSSKCRSKGFRAAQRALPIELTTRERWIRRSSTKVPLTVAGMVASSTDPRTWSRYREASKSTAGAGLGFVLNGDGVVCLDLDHAISPDGSLAPWAEDILRKAGPTYTEVSPSGHGLHIFGFADVRQGRRIRRSGGYAVEVYGTGRFLTVTGDRFRGSPSALADISALVDELT
ncbi:bifunctional DNA primase/polymerase [Streptomyces sp. YPW6]|uniref:bifunctional DNA primase/polymerase n=1 Tax=Streptomyces sp. YPW6 TaxID=2840373 RepID=UPI003EB978E1